MGGGECWRKIQSSEISISLPFAGRVHPFLLFFHLLLSPRLFSLPRNNALKYFLAARARRRLARKLGGLKRFNETHELSSLYVMFKIFFSLFVFSFLFFFPRICALRMRLKNGGFFFRLIRFFLFSLFFFLNF